MIRREIVFFEEGGPEHTDVTIDLTLEAAEELGIDKVVVASTSGDSGVKVAERFKGSGIMVIVVGHQFGFPLPGLSRFKPENMEKLRILDAEVNLGSDALTNSIRQREKLGHSPLSVLTQTLIMMKVKVNLEIVVKASDAGLLMPGEHVISLTGSHQGLDTSVVIEAQDSSKILDIRMRKIIAIPLSRKKADSEYMEKRQVSRSK